MLRNLRIRVVLCGCVSDGVICRAVVDRASDRTAHIVPREYFAPGLLRDFLHRTAFAEANLRLTIEFCVNAPGLSVPLKLALSAAPTTISTPPSVSREHRSDRRLPELSPTRSLCSALRRENRCVAKPVPEDGFAEFIL